MHKYINIFGLIILIFTNHNINAADLYDIYKRALIHNNEFAIVKNDHKVSEEKYNQTFSSIFPDINLTATSNKTEIHRYEGAGSTNDFSSDTYAVNIKQPIFRLAFFDERKKSMDNVKKSNININEKLDTIIIDSVRLYFNVINASNLIEEAELKRELASKIYQSSLKLFERGMITDKILRENKNNLDLNNLDYEITLNNLETTKHEILIFAGRELYEIHDLNPNAEIELEMYDLNNILKIAVSESNAIKSAEFDVSMNKNDLKAKKSQHYPTIDLVASYDYNDTSSGTRFGANKRESSTIGLSLNFPIYQGGFQTSKVRESRINLSSAKLTLDHLKRQIKRDVNDIFNQHSTMRKKMSILKDNYNSSYANLQSAKKGYANGIYTDVALLRSEIEYIESKNNYTRSVFDYLLADLQLKKYSSTLSEQDLLKVNSMLVW